MARQFHVPVKQATETHQKNGFARVVGLRTIDEEGVYTVEVEIFIDEEERKEIYETLQRKGILNELPTVGEKVFDKFHELEEIALSETDEGEILRNHMRQHPPRGGGFPETEEIGLSKLHRVPVARELVKAQITADQWHDFVREWRQRGYSTVKNEDGTTRHDLYDPTCRQCRAKLVGYAKSTQKKILRRVQKGREPLGGFACGDPVPPVELMYGGTAYTRAGLLSRQAQYSHESPTYVNFSLPELAHVIIRLYIPEIKEAVKKRFNFGAELDTLAYGSEDQNIVIPDPERSDPRYLNRIVALQHMQYSFPTNVAYKVPDNQPKWYIYNTEAFVHMGRKPLETNPWDPYNPNDPAEEEGAPAEGLLDKLNNIIQAGLRDFLTDGEQLNTRICDKCHSVGYSAACEKCGNSTHPNLSAVGEVVSANGIIEPVYRLETGLVGLNSLIEAFVPPPGEPYRTGPVCWGIAGRGDTQVIDILQDMINDNLRGGQEIFLLPLTPEQSPIDENGDIFFTTELASDDLEGLELFDNVAEYEIVKKPTNLTQTYQTESLIKKTIKAFPTDEEIDELKERYGTYVDYAGKYGPPGTEYEFDDLLLWVDPDDIMMLETPPPYHDTNNRYIRRSTFEQIKDLYESLRTETDSSKWQKIRDEISDLKQSDSNQVYVWDWIVNPMDPNHPVLKPDKECHFKSILNDPAFQLWLSTPPDEGGAGCIWDRQSLDWKRVYYQNNEFVRFNDPKFWRNSLPDIIKSDAEERTNELSQRENVIVNEILKLIAPVAIELKDLKKDRWYLDNFDKLISPEINKIDDKKVKRQKQNEAKQALGERMVSLTKDADPELDDEERKRKIEEYHQILHKVRNTKSMLNIRAENINKDATAWRVQQLDSPVRLTPPDPKGVEFVENITGEKSTAPFTPDWWKTLFAHVNVRGRKLLLQVADQYEQYNEFIKQLKEMGKDQVTLDMKKQLGEMRSHLPSMNQIRMLAKKYKSESDDDAELPNWFFLRSPKSAIKQSRQFDVKVTELFEQIAEEDDLIAKLRAERRPYKHEERALKHKEFVEKTKKKPLEPSVEVDPTDTKTSSDLKPLGGDPAEPMPGEPGFDAADFDEEGEDAWDPFEDAEEEEVAQDIQSAQEESWREQQKQEQEQEFEPGQPRPFMADPEEPEDDEWDPWG